MDAAWSWLSHCVPDEIRMIVLAHACGANFSAIARRVPDGLGRMTIRRRWEVGIEQIFVGLNGGTDSLSRYGREALASARAAMLGHQRDWSVEERDAWLYGLIVAWHPDELPLIARMHGWDQAMINRLRILHRLLFDSVAAPLGGEPQAP